MSASQMREPAPISNTEADKNNMTADESHLVDEILNELNGSLCHWFARNSWW